MTLVVDKDNASFNSANDIQDAINSLNQTGLSGGNGTSESLIIAHASDPLHIDVAVPAVYEDDPVKFVALLLDIHLPNLRKSRRVMINEREGVIVIGEDVLINPVAINHKNLSIEAGVAVAGFVGLDTGLAANGEPRQMRPKLKSLVDALNALKVPTQDVISIIRTLKSNGDLYGEVIIE